MSQVYSTKAVKSVSKHFAITLLAASTAMIASIPTASAEGFIDDSTLTGGIYYWQRDRERKQLIETAPDYDGGKRVANLKHSTFNANLDFSSGYLADVVGFDFAVFGAVELGQGGPAHPNEIGFSNGKNRWDEDWSGDTSGLSIYKAAAKLKLGPLWVRGGYIQPTGDSILRPHWSFMPGTYRGVEAGTTFDFNDAGALSMTYMWTDKYKAPWYQNMYNFRRADEKTGISYLHSIGMKYDFKNDLVLEAAYGEAKNYMDQFFAKASYKMPVADNPLSMSYQFYGAKDNVVGNGENDVYDGLAWLQALTFNYTTGPFDWRLEGSWVKAEGRQGYFLQRMTPSYASSNGRLDVWWDARSDFNANGEKSLYAGVVYDLAGWDLAGWKVGGAYAYAWDAKPNNLAADQSKRIKESAWTADIMYTVQEGRAKGTNFKLHYTRYDNHSNIPSWSGGYGNVFQDETDVKFIVMAPFTIF